MSSPPTPAAAGWYADPQGQFARRYFDGTVWTPSVQDTSGWTGFEWQAPSRAAPPAPDQPADHRTPAGMIVVLLGIAFIVLSALAFDWVGSTDVHSGRGLPELMDTLDGSTASEASARTSLVTIMLLAPVVITAALVATWPTGYGPRILARLATVGLVIFQLAVHASAGENLQETFGSDLAFGILASVAGYLLVLVGAVVGPRRPRRPFKVPQQTTRPVRPTTSPLPPPPPPSGPSSGPPAT